MVFPRGYRFRMTAQVVAMTTMFLVAVALIVFWPQPFTFVLGGFGLRCLYQDVQVLAKELQRLREQRAVILALAGKDVW